MNRVWLFLCFLCISWVARGQSAYEWRYWFDDAKSQQQTGQGYGTAFSITADVAALDEGMHTIHMQVADTAGRFSPPQSHLFFRVGDRTVKRLRYWFDTDREAIETIPITANQAVLDVNNLEPGLHFIYCQAEDAMGNVSDVESRIFYRPMRTDIASWSYWFDDDHEARHTAPRPDGPVLIDVSDLADGFHIIYQQVSEKTPSAVESRWFIKIPQTVGSADMTCICTIDEKMVGQQRVPANGGIISWDLDVNALPVGLHRAVFQVITATGAASTVAERFFVRAITPTEVGNMQCVYTFDNSDTQSQAGTMANGLFHFDLDVSQLEDGLHRIAYMLVAEDGTTTPQQTAFFWKTPLGGNGIVQYDYWLNDDKENVRSVQIDKRENPLKLISLLPVEPQPIRSSCFEFRVKDGQPLIYAKNDFHIRFHDAQGYFSDGHKAFVDYSVKQEVETVGELQKTQTFPKVAENDIRWYTMQSAPGDTAAFKLSQPATVQVFAPSGKEVFKTSESASVQWAGIHTWEDGTYYVAVHDVTGSRSNMTLDYMHMDKYDIVDWDVHTVGNGGCSTITFKGNGFRDLYRVDLYTAAGDSIHSVDISHDSDAETAVTFDFSGAELGVYDAVFHFTQEDKRFTNIVTVEEAVDIELATNVTFPSTFLRGTSTTYTIKITNKGNMTAYQVPLELKLQTISISNISFVEFGGQLSSFKDDINSLSNDSIIEEIIDELLAVWHNTGDLSQFAFIHDSIDNVDYGISFVFLNLPPKTTRQITVTVKSSSDVYLSAYMTSDWLPISASDYLSENESRRMSAKRANVGDWLCCYRERVECVADVVGSIISSLPGVPPNINCGYQVANTIAQAMYDIGCSEGSPTERFRKYAESKGQSLVGRIKKAAIDCVIGYFFGRINSLREDLKLASQLGNGTEAKRLLNEIQTLQALQRSALNKLYNSGSVIVSAIDCVSKFRTPIPNCPPDPDGGGGSSTPQPPADPNDIYGYLSDAGSKFMTDEVAKVNYTIEFENDTAFAQASAHTIVIRDTLDNRYFDLKSFLPTSVKIGYHETFIDEAADVKTAGGVTSFLKTIDMRPEINAIAQVEGEYSQQTGIAKWTFTSLDPMTMEPTDDLMQGILPVNYDGTSGIGEVMFEVGMKPNKEHGTEIKNRASIVFDYEEPILTPMWVNTVDAIRPVSHVSDVQQMNDSVAVVSIDATDELSGVWRCDVFVQYGSGAWFKAAENVPADTVAYVKIYDGIEHNFYVLATDSAGNVEVKVPEREFTLAVGDAKPTGDVNGDGKVGIGDIIAVTSYMAGLGGGITLEMADVNGDGKVGIGDIVAVTDIMAGTAKARAKNKNLYKTYFVRRKEKMINEP